jgi:hypothetical protein
MNPPKKALLSPGALRSLSRSELQKTAKSFGQKANGKSEEIIAALSALRTNAATVPCLPQQPPPPVAPPPVAPPPPPPPPPPPSSPSRMPAVADASPARRSDSSFGSGSSSWRGRPSLSAGPEFLAAFDPDEGTPPDEHVRPAREPLRSSLCNSAQRRRRSSSVHFAPSTDSPPPSRERLHKRARALSDASLEDDP